MIIAIATLEAKSAVLLEADVKNVCKTVVVDLSKHVDFCGFSRCEIE